MELSVNEQLMTFGIMLLGGAMSGILADLFMLARVAFGLKRLTANLADFILWAVLALGIFALNFFANDGALRWYSLCGLALGAVLYYLLLSRPVRAILKVLEKILGLFLKIVLTILGFLYKILNSVLLLFKRMLAPLGKSARRAGKFVKQKQHRLWLVLKKK